MAVQFLTGLNVNGNININTNQLQNVVIQPLAADPAGIDGRIYYNSSTNKLKIYNGTDWVSFQTGTDGDTTYALTGVGSTNGTAGVRLTGSDASIDDVLIVGGGTTTVTRSLNTLTITSNDQFTGTVTSVTSNNSTFINTVTAGTATDPILTASLSATGTPDATVYLRGDNAWEPISAIPGTYDFVFAGDAGTPTTIVSGAIAQISGGAYISTSSANTGVVTITHDTTSRTNNPIADSPALGGSFQTAGSVTTNATGHVTAVTLQTVTLPTTAVTQSSGDNTTKIATTAFVQAAVTGLLEFKSGFNATTGVIADGSSDDLYTNRAISIGDYYVVTVAGNFFGSAATPLTPGDSVIVQTAAAAGAAVEADFIVVQSDTDLATNATVGLMTIAPSGVGGITSNIVGGVATITNTDTNTSNTATGTITAGNLSGTVTHAFGINTIVQTINSSGDTVFCDITRTATTSVATISAVEATDITILVQRIG